MHPTQGKSPEGGQRVCPNNNESPKTGSSREQTASPPTPGSEGLHEAVTIRDLFADDEQADAGRAMNKMQLPVGSGRLTPRRGCDLFGLLQAQLPSQNEVQLCGPSRSRPQLRAGESILGATPSTVSVPWGSSEAVRISQMPGLTDLVEGMKLSPDSPQAGVPRCTAVFPPSTPTPTRRPYTGKEAIQNRSGAVNASAMRPAANGFPFHSARSQIQYWGPTASRNGLDTEPAPVAGGWPVGTPVSTHRRQYTDGSVPLFASHGDADSTPSHSRRHSDMTWQAHRWSPQTALNLSEEQQRLGALRVPWNPSCPDTAGVSISESATRFLPMQAVLHPEARRAQRQQQQQQQQQLPQQQHQKQQPQFWHDDSLTRPINVMLSQHQSALPPSASVKPPQSTPSINIPYELPQFSANYHGMHTERNASANHLSPAENCALWLTNLPPHVTTTELLAGIRNVGRVWCTYINGPDNEQHTTAAAKVVFFQPVAAQRLLSQALTAGLRIGGLDVRVSHNRIKSAETRIVGGMSRVLIITGSVSLVNAETLTRFFQDRFQFEIDEVIELLATSRRAVVEYRFGSYRCQAQMGKMALDRDLPQGLEKVEFGQDPCETGVEDASFRIAAERIVGIGL